ncbi:MAG: hypothetical protein AAF495_13715 [Pseudomonadota bacterium]
MAAILGPLYMAWAFAPHIPLLGQLALETTFVAAVLLLRPSPSRSDQVLAFLQDNAWAEPVWRAVVRRRAVLISGGVTPTYTLCQRALAALTGPIEVIRQHPGKGEIVALKTYDDGVRQDVITLHATRHDPAHSKVEITSRAYRLIAPIEHAFTGRNVAALVGVFERHGRTAM